VKSGPRFSESRETSYHNRHKLGLIARSLVEGRRGEEGIVRPNARKPKETRRGKGKCTREDRGGTGQKGTENVEMGREG